ncbi:glycoside hydrolase family 97 catalytic domain-containing protein [Luteolibacter pohnpeiensis]|uniref:Glycoside hydrolase family 97 catalytic domain-containing protein n=1 Tax=Luteolibacter pohnpeiensis TaxID=454153 RepID=A0A934VUT0_9BACT|nr:glycoside hydrolase family 97 protein [Luteolibacter pohnpeiensis]MBK1881078.1 glycoside hydrolase family 97 catalytic domain-containing protein [Luteolibacter pohnpeiensis]
MKWLSVLLAIGLAEGKTIPLSSPDSRNRISLEITETGEIHYTVERDGISIIDESPLGLITSDGDFTKQLRLLSVSDPSIQTENYTLISGNQRSVHQEHRRLSIKLENANSQSLFIDLDAGNEGVAFRYRFDQQTGSPRTIQSESTGFKISEQAHGWISPYNNSSDTSPAYEDYYFKTQPGSAPPDSRGGKTRGWYFPALFELPTGKWILLTESATTENYPGCHLASDSQGGIYHIEFPFPDERTQGVDFPPSALPQHQLPWTMPWRVIALADSAAGIANSTLVTDLAPACEIDDVSWIRPGRASWSWWAHPDSLDQTATSQIYQHYLDGAEHFAWEYTLLDAGWWQTDMAKMRFAAEQKGIGLLAWTHANDFYDPKKRAAKLDEFKQMGVAGIKIDFWCSDRQETMEAIQSTLREAATRHLLVDLHGCPLTRGWQRTFPNLISAEAVLGTESYMFDERYPEKSAELNAILPFTRNVMGPMDYTPLGLGKKGYARQNSAAHELATAFIFNSGIVHFADDPKIYEKFPAPAQDALRSIRAAWDETRYLIARPGELVVVARRAGKSWFIAGINGQSKDEEITLHPSEFAPFQKAFLIAEGSNPLDDLSSTPLNGDPEISHVIPAKGGILIWLSNPE